MNILFNFGKEIFEKDGVRYDLNLDGVVDDKDFKIVLNNFDKRDDLYNEISVNQITLNSVEPNNIYYENRVI